MSRSMDNLEQLTDSELRHRLLQYGFPNLPITDTTRKVLIKKLRNYINNEKAKLRRDAKLATRYSSDEETDTKVKKRESKFSTANISSKSLTNDTYQRPTIFSSNLTVPSILRRRVTLMDSPSTPSPINSITRGSVSSTTSGSKHLSQKSGIYIPPPILSINNGESDMSPPPPPIKSRYSYSFDRFSTSPSSSFTSGIIDSQSPILNGRNSNNESPYTSATRRLLSLRGETIRDSVLNKSGNRSRLSTTPPSVLSTSYYSPDPTEIVHQQPEPKLDQSLTPSAAFSNFINRLDEQYGVKQTLIPCALLSTFIFFFALVAFMYMTISPDLANTINEKNTIYTICNLDSSNSAVAALTYNCVEKDYLDHALEILKILAPELEKRAKTNKCVDKTSPSILSAKEAIRLVQQKGFGIDVRKTIRSLHNLEYLIEVNPQWKINHVDANGNIITFDEVLQLRHAQANYFAVKNPKLPLTCALYNKLQKFFFYIGGIGLISIIYGLFYIIYKIFSNYQQSKRDIVTNFIYEINNTLMKTAAADSDRSTVIVSHLRDKLIPAHKRKKLEWAWNEAIKSLELNESRIQFDLGVVNGEQVKLMKWIDTIGPERIGQRSQIKKWHSPAFDKTNKIANPPTPCLKIRQMFDRFEANNPNLKTIIQDAILEKVGPNCKIYDIQLNKTTCCVYVRCASVKDAGIVHNEINGWWFDKRLVSIKFLRLEKYLSRFPKSSSGPTYLRPSNSQNLSMSQCSRNSNSMNDTEDDVDEGDN